MRPSKHVAVSVGLTFLLSQWFSSWTALTACFLSGIVIDFDHVWDFYAHKKRIPLRYREITDFCENAPLKKLYLILHAYELLLILWWAIAYFQLNEVWISTAAGLTVHLFFDQFTNPLKPLGYFIIYRFINNFDAERILKFKYWEIKSGKHKDTF